MYFPLGIGFVMLDHYLSFFLEAIATIHGDSSDRSRPSGKPSGKDLPI